MRSLIVAAVVALTFASGANAAQVDYFNKSTNPLAAHGRIGSASGGGGGGKASSYSGGSGGAGKVAHCAPGAKGKACHKA
jgi:hypothetical protein